MPTKTHIKPFAADVARMNRGLPRKPTSPAWILWSRDGQRGELPVSLFERPARPPDAADGQLLAAEPTAGAAATLSRGEPTAGAAATLSPWEPAADSGQLSGGRRAPHGAGPRPGRSSVYDALIDEIIVKGQVHTEFQPILDVITGQTVGFEAFSRGPEGPLRMPGELFAAARAVDRAGELDWVCRAAAFAKFLEADLHPTISLFVNVERDSLVTPCPTDLLAIVWEAERRLRVFVDIEGRAVSRYPREVYETVRHARAARWGVSMNDLEVSSAAIALLPVLEPDVVRLNRQAQGLGLHRSRLAMFAALAEAEQTGAALITERIADRDADASAVPSGTRYKQGFFHGQPGPLPRGLPAPQHPLRILEHLPDDSSPFDITVKGGTTASAVITTAGMFGLIRDFVALVDAAPEPTFVGVLTPDEGTIDAGGNIFGRAMADKSALHLVLGRHVSVLDDWCTHAVDLPGGHPFLDQVCFVALSPNLATLVSFRTSDGVDSGWEVAISQNPITCRQVIRRLLAEVDTLEGGVLAGGR